MAIKTLHINSADIFSEKHNRFDVKYYVVNNFFENLAQKQSFKVETLETVKKQIISGSYIETYTTKEQGIPYLRVGDIKPFSFDENEEELKYVSSLVAEKIKVKPNDVIIGRTASLGIASIIDDDNAGCAISQHISKITTDINKLSPHYLVAYFNSKFFKLQMEAVSQGALFKELTHSQLNQVRVFIPEKELYEAIIQKIKMVVDYNRQANNLIKSATAVFKNAIALNAIKKKQSYFESDLASLMEFDIWNATCHLPFFADNEKKLKQKFSTVKLGEIADIKKGDEVGSDNYEIYLEKKETDFAFIRTSDIINNEIDLFPDYFISENIYKTVNQELKAGDVLFTKDGKIGQTAIVTESDRAIIASGVARIRLKKQIGYNFTSEYLFTVLSVKETGFNPAIRRTVIGTTIPHLREERLKQIAIPMLKDEIVNDITQHIKTAFELKAQRKKLILEVLQEIDKEYEKYS